MVGRMGKVARNVEEKKMKRFFLLATLSLVLWVLYGISVYSYDYLWQHYAKIRMGWR